MMSGNRCRSARMRNANLARRQDIRAIIGPVAEELAYLYTALERRSLFGNSARDGDYTVHDLFLRCEVPVQERRPRTFPPSHQDLRTGVTGSEKEGAAQYQGRRTHAW